MSSKTDNPAAGRPIQVKCLDHVTLVVEDMDRSQHFYVDVLGMQQVERPAFSFQGMWFEAGDTQIHLILEHSESGPAGNRPAEELALSRTHHFAFLVDDARDAAERLAGLNVPIVSGPKSRPDGFTQVFVRDPDGYIVELCSQAS